MTRATKYVALDVHQATTVASVRAETRRVIARTILPTEEPALLEFFRGMRGAIHGATPLLACRLPLRAVPLCRPLLADGPSPEGADPCWTFVKSCGACSWARAIAR